MTGDRWWWVLSYKRERERGWGTGQTKRGGLVLSECGVFLLECAAQMYNHFQFETRKFFCSLVVTWRAPGALLAKLRSQLLSVSPLSQKFIDQQTTIWSHTLIAQHKMIQNFQACLFGKRKHNYTSFQFFFWLGKRASLMTSRFYPRSL